MVSPRLRLAQLLMPAAAVIAAVLIAGCGGHRPSAGDETAFAALPDVTAEAYLFDTFIHHNGKRTSVRLELFATDTLLAAGGRAYLGKGALKGWIRDDSLRIYFPQSDEYVYEPLTDLLRSVSCNDDIPVLKLLDLFFHPPDSATLTAPLVLTADWSNRDNPIFDIGMAECPWQIALTYDQRPPGLRLRKFTFDNGDNLKIEANRREYRAATSVAGNKFQLHIPGSAVQIIP